MARSGRFGRLPRAAPSLTNTIVSLARESQNQRDQNIMDAWQKGGTFEGKQVTDQMVEDYWQARLGTLAKTDPEYDKIKLVHDQVVYNVAESKIGLAYKQGKIGESAVAQFYLGWAKKVPQDSAFWRTLMTDAAQFSQAAKARARSAGSAAASASYNDQQSKTMAGQVQLGTTLTSLMEQIAKNNGLIGQKQDLTNFMLDGQNDPGKMETLIRQVNDAIHSDPKTWAGVVSAIKASDPHWDGQFTSAYFASALNGQVQGYVKLKDNALANGKATDAKKYGKLATDTNMLGAQVASWPAASAYSKARDLFDSVWNSPQATDADKATAAATLAASIDGILKMPGLAAYQATALQNDAAALRGDPNAGDLPSFYENFNGAQNLTMGEQPGTTGNQRGENAAFSKFTSEQTFWQAQMDANPGAYVYASYKTDASGNRVFDPSGNGPVGIVSRQSVANDPSPTKLVPVPTITGNAVMQAVPVQPVVVDNPADPGGKGTVIGQSITTTVGGVSTTLYGITRPDGSTDWTPVAPWADGVTQTIAKDGSIHLKVPMTSSSAVTAANDLANKYSLGSLAGAFVNGQTPPAGTSWTVPKQKNTSNKVTIKWDGQGFTVQESTQGPDGNWQDNPAQPYTPSGSAISAIQADAINSAWDKGRATLGANPRIDFPTAMMAQLVASRASGDAVISAWQSPQFQQQLTAEEWVAAGGSLDGTKQPDPRKLQQLAQNDQFIARDMAATGNPAYGETAPDIWDKGARDEVAATRLAKFDALSSLTATANQTAFAKAYTGMDTASESYQIRTAAALTIPAGTGFVGNPQKEADSNPLFNPITPIGPSPDRSPITPTPIAPAPSLAPKSAPITPVPLPGKAADDTVLPTLTPAPNVPLSPSGTTKKVGTGTYAS